MDQMETIFSEMQSKMQHFIINLMWNVVSKMEASWRL